MRRVSFRRVVCVLSSGASLLLASCGGGGDAAVTTPDPAPIVSSVSVAPATVTLVVGAEQTLTATPLANGQAIGGRTIAWSSTAPGIVSVSAAGVVRGLAAGSATITATVDGRSGTSAVVVENPAPLLSGIAPSTAVAGAASLTITVNGSAFAVGSVVEWNGSARPTTVLSTTQLSATIAAADLVQVGTYPIRVRTPAPGGGTSSAAMFTITPLPVGSVVLTPDTATLVPGETRSLIASVRDSLGRPLSGRSVAFASSNPAVVTVSASSGVISAVARGSASVTATAEGKSAVAAINVRAGRFIGASGGQLTVGNTILDIPANAVASGTAFTVDSLASPAAAPGLMTFSAVQLGPNGLTFASPVTVSMRWSAGQLPGGADPSLFAVHRFNGTAWVPLANREVDLVSQVVRGTTPGFSAFAILQLPPAPLPALSNDELLFVRVSDNALCVLNVATLAVRTLLASAVEAPAISTDRRTIAYLRRIANKSQIMLADYNGQNVRALTDGQFNDGPPSFSGDGTRVFFSRDLSGGGNWKVMSAAVTGGALTQHTVATTGTLPNDFTPVVDPAYTRIVMARSLTGGATRIATTSLGGLQPLDLTPIGTSTPVISPNGARIAYLDAQTSGVSRIMLMNIDGTNQSPVVTVSGTAGGLSWSPDGTRLVFHVLNATTAFNFQLFSIHSDGSGLTQLTTGTSAAGYFARWSRN